MAERPSAVQPPPPALSQAHLAPPAASASAVDNLAALTMVLGLPAALAALPSSVSSTAAAVAQAALALEQQAATLVPIFDDVIVPCWFGDVRARALVEVVG